MRVNITDNDTPSVMHSVGLADVAHVQTGKSLTFFATEGPSVHHGNETRPGGRAAIINVSLGSEPWAAVTVRADGGGDIESPPALTFNESNWNVPQPLRLQPNDDDRDEPKPALVRVPLIVSSDDPAYSSSSAPGPTVAKRTHVQLSLMDNDWSAIVLSAVAAAGNFTLREGGAASNFSVHLASQPSSKVTLTLHTPNVTVTNLRKDKCSGREWNETRSLAQLVINPTVLVFNDSPDDWRRPRQVQLRAPPDGMQEGGGGLHQARVGISAASADANFDSTATGMLGSASCAADGAIRRDANCSGLNCIFLSDAGLAEAKAASDAHPDRAAIFGAARRAGRGAPDDLEGSCPMLPAPSVSVTIDERHLLPPPQLVEAVWSNTGTSIEVLFDRPVVIADDPMSPDSSPADIASAAAVAATATTTSCSGIVTARVMDPSPCASHDAARRLGVEDGGLESSFVSDYGGGGSGGSGSSSYSYGSLPYYAPHPGVKIAEPGVFVGLLQQSNDTTCVWVRPDKLKGGASNPILLRNDWQKCLLYDRYANASQSQF